METMDEGKRARAHARKAWKVARYTLGQEPSEDLSQETTMEERLAMLWPLAKETWAIMGKPLPRYSRQNIPIIIFRPRDEQR